MFKDLVIKFSYLPPLFCALLVGCGKGVTKDGEDNKDVRQPALSNSIITLSNDGQSAIQEYTFLEMGKVYIPEDLNFISGSREAKTKVIFDVGDQTEFFCLYGFTSADDYSLINCYYRGSVSNTRGGDAEIQYFGEKMKIDSSDAKVSADFDIDWY